MDWIGLGVEKWTQVKLWYVNHYYLVNLTTLH